jgi:para-nitrobenzyl esterase
MFGTLDTSWRPYRERDKEVSGQMLDYLANFAKSGNPNGSRLPVWDPMSRKNGKVLCYTLKNTKMGHPSYGKMAKNMLTKGDPKA